MITKLVNKAKLLEDLKGLPISDIIIEPVEIRDVMGNFVKMSTGVQPVILRQATQEEVQQIWQIINNHVYEEDYKEKRIVEYGNIAEQLDKIWHDIDNGTLDKTGAFYNYIKAVKDNSPKTKIKVK
jgi:hypothetical protein